VRYTLDLEWVYRGLSGTGEGGTVKAEDYILSYGKGNENHRLGTGIFVHHRIISVVTRVYFVSDRMSYIIPRGRRCNIIVLSVHAPSEKKSDGIQVFVKN